VNTVTSFKFYFLVHLDRRRGYNIQVKVNEKPVPWPMGDRSSMISLEEFQKRMQICDLKNFNFEKDCHLKNGNTGYLKASFTCVFYNLVLLWFLKTIVHRL